MHSIAIQKEDLFGQVRTFSQTIFNNLQLKDSKGLLNSDYMNLYNGISTFADKGPRKHGENLHEKGLFELFNAQLSSFFEGIFKSLNEKKGIAYLEEFVECSTNYSFYAGWLVRLFKYLDQFYMKRLSMDLTRVSFEKFKSTFLNNIQYELFAEVFNLLDNEREGFESNKTLILKVIKFYFMMCYDKDIKLEYDKDRNQFQFTGINQNNDFAFYKNEFETKLIDNIKNYYLKKINTRWITETSSEFISQSLEALKREENMAIFYYPISKDKIREFLKKLLIEDFYEQVLDNPKSGLKEMLMNAELKMKKKEIETSKPKTMMICSSPDKIPSHHDFLKINSMFFSQEKIEKDQIKEYNLDPGDDESIVFLCENYNAIHQKTMSLDNPFSKCLTRKFNH